MGQPRHQPDGEGEMEGGSAEGGSGAVAGNGICAERLVGAPPPVSFFTGPSRGSPRVPLLILDLFSAEFPSP
jgi:hypothetical protein